MYYREFDIKHITSLVPDIELDPEDIEYGYVTLSFDTIDDMENFEKDCEVRYEYSLYKGYDPLVLSVSELIHYKYELPCNRSKAERIGKVEDNLFHIGHNFYTNQVGWDYLNN